MPNLFTDTRHPMKRFYLPLLCLLLLCARARFVFSEEPVADEAGKTAVRGLIGGAETLLSNGVIMGYNVIYNSITGNAPWAVPDYDSIYRNFTTPWSWEDTDGFRVNQFGHPYQGSMYFNAGRVNGFGFYESALSSVLGSSTWEVFFESNHASMNDFITTVTGSTAIGEMLYRLYADSRAANIPAFLSFLINPMAGLHSLITGWKPAGTNNSLYQFQVYSGTGYAQTYYSVSDSKQELFSFKGLSADIGVNVVYGNPFEQDTWIPFRHFELAASFGIGFGDYNAFRVVSDGYLFSFSPVYTVRDTMSTGLSTQYDFVSLGKLSMYNSTIDQYSNALDWTIKYQHLFSHDTAIQIKCHAGFTFMGVSDYYSPDTYDNELRNYGYGLNSKLFINLENEKIGKLAADLFCYSLWAYPGTSALSRGTVFWLFADITYSRFISKHMSAGVTDFFSLEQGTFGDFPNTSKNNNAVKFFIAWNL